MVTTKQSDIERLVESIRSIVGALNAKDDGGNSLPSRVVRIETRLDVLERQINNMNKLLAGIGVGVITLVIQMVVQFVVKHGALLGN